ncbi:hypothetical protein GGU11DRAFT_802093 [Lentinula aff. detonsa]|nr:hypothetical protein GGU11DRAFT_802093 [Lentinula aff. detonsa]
MSKWNRNRTLIFAALHLILGRHDKGTKTSHCPFYEARLSTISCSHDMMCRGQRYLVKVSPPCAVWRSSRPIIHC